VFTPTDTLKLELLSVPIGKAAAKDKEKDGTCAADVLIVGTVPPPPD